MLYKERVPIDHSEITYYIFIVFVTLSCTSIKDNVNWLNSVMQDLVHPNQGMEA